MNSWHSNTLPYNGGHHRSVSAVGYNDTLYPLYDQFETNQAPNSSKLSNQYYASYMDISNTGVISNGSKRHFSWRSSTNNPNGNVTNEKIRHPFEQRPFESAFKAAISKMKESSIYRVNDVDQRVNPISYAPITSNQMYNRNCTTLQPRKTDLVSSLVGNVPKQSNHIFRCNSTSDRVRDRSESTTMFRKDYASETEWEKTDTDNTCHPVTNHSSREIKVQKQAIASVPMTNGSSDSYKINSSARVLIPASSKYHSQDSMPNSSVISETIISSTIVCKPQSSYPRTETNSFDIEQDSDCEPLPSVQDIIAKVEALTNDNSSNKIMSKSLILTSEKPPLKKLQKSNSQRGLDGYSSSSQSDQSVSSGQRMSGVYKKNYSIAVKGNPINKMPFDFQKLHLAFLEQKKEIQNLKQELEEKKAYIVQLESEIRNYEPWR